jgi:hypothetical protein
MPTRQQLPFRRGHVPGSRAKTWRPWSSRPPWDSWGSEGSLPVWRPWRRWRQRWPLGLLALVLSVAHLASVGATPIASGPRDPLRVASVPDRWTPPLPVTDERFATFPLVDAEGKVGLWLLPTSKVPLEFIVEREVLDRFGEDELQQAIETWNDTPGSRFGARISRVVDAGVEERRRDGANRIFLDRRSCGGRYLARAHLWPGELVVRSGLPARYISEVDLGLCDRLRPEQLAGVIRHELGHIAGLDHLCDEGEDCHRRGMDADNTCRVMSPRAHSCQEPTQGDLDGLVHLHPRLPRVTGGDGRTTSASASFATHPTRRAALRTVITPVDADPDLQVSAAALAGYLGAPHLLVDDECTSGPDGRALDRVIAVAGTVLAAGPVNEGCLATLRGAWALQVDHLPDRAAVLARMVEQLALTDRPPPQLFVAPGTELDPTGQLAGVAATAAVAARAPLLLLDDPDDAGAVLDLLDTEDRVTEITMVGDLEVLPLGTQLVLANEGAYVRRVPAADGGEAAVALSRFRHLWGTDPLSVTLASVDEPAHVLVGVGVAASEGGLLVPIEDALRVEHAELLRERADRGAIVGGTRAIGADRQITLSRLVDGVG